MTSPEPLTNRVVELEMLVTHLQREVRELNGTLLAQQQQLDRVTLQLERLGSKVATLEEQEPQRSPADERPPHY